LLGSDPTINTKDNQHDDRYLESSRSRSRRYTRNSYTYRPFHASQLTSAGPWSMERHLHFLAAWDFGIPACWNLACPANGRVETSPGPGSALCRRQEPRKRFRCFLLRILRIAKDSRGRWRLLRPRY
jgi:hypothetical protein